MHDDLSPLTPQSNPVPNGKPGPPLPSRGTGNGAGPRTSPHLQNDKGKVKMLLLGLVSDAPPMQLVKGIVKTSTGYDITYCTIQCDRSTTTTTTTTTTRLYATPKLEEGQKLKDIQPPRPLPPRPPPAPNGQGVSSGNVGGGSGAISGGKGGLNTGANSLLPNRGSGHGSSVGNSSGTDNHGGSGSTGGNGLPSRGNGHGSNNGGNGGTSTHSGTTKTGASGHNAGGRIGSKEIHKSGTGNGGSSGGSGGTGGNIGGNGHANTGSSKEANNGANNGGSGGTGKQGGSGNTGGNEHPSSGGNNGGNMNGGNGGSTGNQGGSGNTGGSGHHYGQISGNKEKQQQSSQNKQTANNGVNRVVPFNNHVSAGGNNGASHPSVNNVPPQASISSVQNSNGPGAQETNQNGHGTGNSDGAAGSGGAAVGHGHGHGGGGGGGGCFSGEMTAQTKFGTKRMDELLVGDEVLVATSDQIESYQPIEWFYHRNENIEFTFVTITTASNKTLSLTTNHLLPLVPCFQKRITLSDLADYVNYDSVFAYKAKPGLCLATKFGQYFQSDVIVEVNFSIKRGVYSPITTHGTIVVNGIQSSCYSTVENHLLQYGLHKSLLYFRNLLSQIINLFYSQSDLNGNQRDIPSVLMFVLEVAQLVVPSLTYV